MTKFTTFVNGSNLFGSFKYLDVYVNDYEALYRYVFEQTVLRWEDTFFLPNSDPLSMHQRVYWYVVDAMDEWDLNNPRTRTYLQERFSDDRDVKTRWMAEAARLHTGTAQEIEQKAFSMCLGDVTHWYEKRQSILSGMNRFYHAVETASEFIEIRRCGRWKVDILHKTVTERGLDVQMAVDMLDYAPNFDVATIVAGDTDGIASIESIKARGKQLGVVEMVRGGRPDQKIKGFATRLKTMCDFTVPIYEQELLKLGIATRGGGGDFSDNG
jgi:uncharacterized LabA/DUF88 family protein